MHSIKTKLILAVSILIIFLFGTAGYMLIDEKEKELTSDIYLRARSFAEMSVSEIISDYEEFLKEGAFVFFNREINDIFRKNKDISEIVLTSYTGEILYSSVEERQRQYVGKKRIIEQKDFLERIQAVHPSFKLSSGRVVYLDKDEEGNFKYLDSLGGKTPEISNTERIEDIIYPYKSAYTIVYVMTYKFLDQRILDTTKRIVLLTFFGILVGLAAFYLLASGITRPLEKLKKGVLVIAKGNFEGRVFVKTKDEIGVLADSVNKMAADLEKSMKALVYRERVAKELEVAAKIQQDLLPKKIPKVEGLEIAASLIPAAEIGGDCFDFLQPDSENTIIYVGDVTGHGVPSGLVVAIANAIIFSLSKKKNIRDILIETNNILRLKTSASMFLTMLLVNWNSTSNILSYVSAGHERVIYYNARERKVSILESGGVAIGILPDISSLLTERQISPKQGDVILLYTDGLTEARAASGEMYGVSRLADSLSRHAVYENIDAVKQWIFNDVKKFAGDTVQQDDMALVVMRKV